MPKISFLIPKCYTPRHLLCDGFQEGFSQDGNEGRVIWFTPEGKVSSIATFEEGQLVGWHMSAVKNGVVRHQSGKVAFFNQDGQFYALVDAKQRMRVAYYANGASAFMEVEHQHKTWNEAGEEVAHEAVAADVDKILADMAAALEEWLAAE